MGIQNRCVLVVVAIATVAGLGACVPTPTDPSPTTTTTTSTSTTTTTLALNTSLSVVETVSVDNGVSYSSNASSPPFSSAIIKVSVTNVSASNVATIQFESNVPAGLTYLVGSGGVATSTSTTYTARNSLTEGSSGYAYAPATGAVGYAPAAATGTLASGGVLVLFFKITTPGPGSGAFVVPVTVSSQDSSAMTLPLVTTSSTLTV